MTFFCWRQKRNWKKQNDKSLSYFFFDKCVEFFSPLTIVLLFYLVLSLIVNGISSWATISVLEKFESKLDLIYQYVAWFKLEPLVAAMVIGGVIILDLFLSLFFKYKDMASRYKYYDLWSKRIYTIFILLCCFTFFGNAVGEKHLDLRTNIDNIRKEYAKIKEDAEEILSGLVQQKLYEKIIITYVPYETRDKIFSINILHKDEKVDHKINGDFIYYSDPEPFIEPEPINPPEEVNAASIKKSLHIIKEIKKNKFSRFRFVSLIKLDGTKQLFCQFPKSFTYKMKSSFFATAMAQYPILEPIVDIFVRTFDKVVEEKVKASVDKIVASFLKGPQTADQVVDKEAKIIVDSIEVKKDETRLEEIKNIVEKIKKNDEISRNNEKEKNKNTRLQAMSLLNYLNKSDFIKCTCKCDNKIIWTRYFLSVDQCYSHCPNGRPCK